MTKTELLTSSFHKFVFSIPGKYENIWEIKIGYFMTGLYEANNAKQAFENEAFWKKYPYSLISRTENLYIP